MFFKRLMREPLLHFLLIGAALFIFYDLYQQRSSEAPTQIVINRGQLAQLVANFERTWMRVPTETELAGLVEDYIREEVLYREALAIGLDQNDPVVRRRMRTKYEAILEQLASAEISDKVLQAFLNQNPDKFLIPTKISFEHIYFNVNNREHPQTDARKILTRLKDGVESNTSGDPMLMPQYYSLVSRQEIERVFGAGFASEVINQLPGQWTGPYYSAYGVHLVKVNERQEASMPPLETIRPRVERDYLAQQLAKQKELAYKTLRQNYQVTIESPDASEQSNIIATAHAGEAQ